MRLVATVCRKSVKAIFYNFSHQPMIFCQALISVLSLINHGNSTILIVGFVSKKTVERKAFDHAKALVEVYERL